MRLKATCTIGCKTCIHFLENIQILRLFSKMFGTKISKNSTSFFAKKKPVDFDGELKIGDVRYDNIT